MIDVETWARDYGRAWETRDPEAAAALFTEDATYRSNIFEEPHRARDGLSEYWTAVTASQSDVHVTMGRPIVDGDRASVEFWTRMTNDGVDITLPGCLLLTFDSDGRCRSLHEYYTFGEGRLDPPPEFGGGVG